MFLLIMVNGILQAIEPGLLLTIGSNFSIQADGSQIFNDFD